MALVHGIDLGSWKVRVATFEGGLRRAVMREVVEMESGEGAAAALAAIRTQDAAFTNADHVASLPLEHASVHLVKLPFTDKTQILKALPAEVEAGVPYDLEDMVLATHFVDTTTAPSRTLAIVAPREKVAARLATLKEAKADPKVLALDAQALSGYAETGVQAVVDVGHRRTVVVVCRDGEMLAARLVSGGGAALTDAIREAFGCTPADAEAYKHQLSLTAASSHLRSDWTGEETTDAGQLGGDPTRRALRAVLTEVDGQLSDLRANLIALEDELGVGVDEVLLCGGGALLVGLGDRMGEQLGLPVRAVDVPGGQSVAAALAVALGRVATGQVRVADLRVGDFAYKGHADMLWNVVFYGVAAAAAALVAGTVMFGLSVHDLNSRLAELESKTSASVTSHFPDVTEDAVATPSQALVVMKEKTTAAAQRVATLGATVSGVPPTLETLRALSLAVPPGSDAKIDVRELTINDDAITFKADTDSYDSSAKIEEALKKSDKFAQAHKSDEKKAGDIVTFSMSIPLKAEDAPAEAPADAPAPEGAG